MEIMRINDQNFNICRRGRAEPVEPILTFLMLIPLQIDGNFGAAGMIEMVVCKSLGIASIARTSFNGREGEIKGLKARGNFEVDMMWENNQLKKALIKSNMGGNVQYGHQPCRNSRSDGYANR